mgnify:CR=1 FL=1
MTGDVRRDVHLGTVVHVVANRQARPNLPTDGCPFCPGGLEAPTEYVTRAFPNRWPALGPDRCEVVLHSPDHDATMVGLGARGVRAVVDLWAERTTELISRPGVEFVLVFENRGASIGATIDHPHSQIYAFDHVPARQRALIDAGWTPDVDPGDRLVHSSDSWTAWTHDAPIHPVSIVLAPRNRVGTLADLDDRARDGLATAIVDLLARCASILGDAMPYMLWINQAPRTDPRAWMHVEIVSPWRAPGVPRYIAAAEVATGEYFNPVDPADLAVRLRAAR